METMAFLGCSRGLGRAITLEMDRQGAVKKALLSSRKTELLQSLGNELSVESQIQTWDFAQSSSVPLILDAIKKFQPERLFYFAGGGPFGNFADKEWKDHLWATQVCYLTPAELLHLILQNSDFSFIRQVVFIGSQIADSRPDPKAASYAAAKHALRGLVESVIAEEVPKDVRLFRPPYINTELLPPKATPRMMGATLAEPEKLAKDFVKWVLDPLGAPIFDAFA